ncbi:MAG: hypothetical protein ACK56I_24345, partial [bacterium]
MVVRPGSSFRKPRRYLGGEEAARSCPASIRLRYRWRPARAQVGLATAGDDGPMVGGGHGVWVGRA